MKARMTGAGRPTTMWLVSFTRWCLASAANGSCRSRRQIKHSTLHEGAAIINPNVYRLAITWIAHDKTGTKGQAPVSNCSSIGIEKFA
jgi:hypothetical protein